MTGKIDLTYAADGRWYVLDYKSNRLPAYDRAALDAAMAHSEYDLQALLYTLALHRWLRFRLGDAYDYARDFGGVRYLFCRGLDAASRTRRACARSPIRELVDALDALLRRGGARMSLLDALYRARARLRPVDHALRAEPAPAGPRHRTDLSDERPVLAAAALASLAIARGHAAFDPAQPHLVAGRQRSNGPTRDAWRDALQAFALGRHARSRRGRRQRRAAGAGRRPALPAPLPRVRASPRRRPAPHRRRSARRTATSHALAPLFATLFPHARDGDRQARAAALALLQSLLLVTGGPGTGKTTTITRVLLLLIAQARLARPASRRASRWPRPPVAPPNAWPRACARPVAQLRGSTASMRRLCDALPDAASTLHRLLGTIPDSPRFRHDADQPLPFDVIVVDEASMVDLPLMCKLVEAVADGARLILLGDRDQLPSVEAGDVLAAITDAAGEGDALPAALAHALRAVAWRRCRATAEHGARWRAIACNCSAAIASRSRSTWRRWPMPCARATPTHRARCCAAARCAASISTKDVADPLAGPRRETLLSPWRALLEVRRSARRRCSGRSACALLTALREGAQGAGALNARIEEALAGAQRDPYFHGRLLLVTENSYRHGLFNGDIGVCQRDAQGHTVAWFAGGSEGVRGFHPAALPAHTGAFAMTVHKAQGSEFDTVWLLLPRQDARTLVARTALHRRDARTPRTACVRAARRCCARRWRGMRRGCRDWRGGCGGKAAARSSFDFAALRSGRTVKGMSITHHRSS